MNPLKTGFHLKKFILPDGSAQNLLPPKKLYYQILALTSSGLYMASLDLTLNAL